METVYPVSPSSLNPDCLLQQVVKDRLDVAWTGLLSNQGEKSINLFFHKGSFKTKSIDFYFIRAPLRKKVLQYGTPKPSGASRQLVKPFPWLERSSLWSVPT